MNFYSTKELQLKLEEIHQSLIRERNQKSNIGLLSGKMGEAIFHYQYSQFKYDFSIQNYGEELLNDIVSEINNGFNFPTFCSGIYGIAWGFNFLVEENYITIKDSSFFKEFDKTLNDGLSEHYHNQHFDFLHGYIGIGLYILKRFINSKSEQSRKEHKYKLMQIVSHLRKNAITHQGLVSWTSNFDRIKGEQGSNLGLAHGMAGIINFLSRLVVHKDFTQEVSPLLQKAVQFLLQFKRHKGFSLFPNRSLNENKNSRLAWCYGDLGIGLSLWHASIALNSVKLHKEAIAILRHSSNRKNLKLNLVSDACLCHGTMGNMLIFNHLYKKTQISDFKEASDFWLAKGMEMAIHENGHAGFMSRHYEKEKWVWKKETDILDGASGIGLALISYLSFKPLKWSQCLMIA